MQDVGRGLCSVRERGDWEQGLMVSLLGQGENGLGRIVLGDAARKGGEDEDGCRRKVGDGRWGRRGRDARF